MPTLLHAFHWPTLIPHLPHDKVLSEVSFLSAALATMVSPSEAIPLLRRLCVGRIVLYALEPTPEDALVLLRHSLLAGIDIDHWLPKISSILVDMLSQCTWPEPSPIISTIRAYYSLRLGDPWLTVHELRRLLPPSSLTSVLVDQCLCIIVQTNGRIDQVDFDILISLAIGGDTIARAVVLSSLPRGSMAVLPQFVRLSRILAAHGVRSPLLGVEDLLPSPGGEGCRLSYFDALRLFRAVKDSCAALATALVPLIPFDALPSTLTGAGSLEELSYINAVADVYPIIRHTVISSGGGPLQGLLLRRLQLLSTLTPTAIDEVDNNNTYGFLSSLGSWFKRAVGYTRPPPPPSAPSNQDRGIRILALDGGGSRSLLTLAILKALGKYLPSQRISQYFDLIVGTSAGGLVALGIGCLNLPLDTSSAVARDISVAAFSKGGTLGSLEKLLRIFFKGEKHDSRAMSRYLRQIYGELSMLDTTALCGSSTKVAVVTALTTVSPPEPFLFRNYNYPESNSSRYQGDRNLPIYQCARATTAAPVYFAPVVLEDGRVIQDGALVANNPAHLALHEAARIFPNRSVDCLLSIGTGRVPIEKLGATYTAKAGLYSITRDLLAMVYSATSTEVTSHILADILDTEVYYRLQPDLPRPVELDEADDTSLDELIKIAEVYVKQPEVDRLLRTVANKLIQGRGPYSKL
ncbi:hypothetical protein FOL47_000392 [Perkinsus chesapeaki]|uniref:PNPLA domain-containing protein n=1 Tax=Perkinsus chesapeaki TaxID=330153 RepID=A0A7J6MMJ2_PERCH|nr:hypothetical protein FOL47_000392 [Perkinsus chesapeaki]